jgi:hypothetical protein
MPASLYFFLAYLPEFVVWLVGIGLALVRWQHDPRAARLTLVGLALLLTVRLVGGYLNAQLPEWVAGMPGGSAVNLRLALTFSGCVQSLLAAIGFGLLLAAIFNRPGDVHGEADTNVEPQGAIASDAESA